MLQKTEKNTVYAMSYTQLSILIWSDASPHYINLLKNGDLMEMFKTRLDESLSKVFLMMV